MCYIKDSHHDIHRSKIFFFMSNELQLVVRESWYSGLTVSVSLISLWLKNNAAEAMRKQIGSLPRVEELNRLKKEICYNFNLTDIRYTQMKNLTEGNSTTKQT